MAHLYPDGRPHPHWTRVQLVYYFSKNAPQHVTIPAGSSVETLLMNCKSLYDLHNPTQVEHLPHSDGDILGQYGDSR